MFRKSKGFERDQSEREPGRDPGGAGAQWYRQERFAENHHRSAEAGLGIGSHSRSRHRRPGSRPTRRNQEENGFFVSARRTLRFAHRRAERSVSPAAP